MPFSNSKADLHVHSKYSEHPNDWFLKRLGAAESYTEPEYIYQTAKASGMTYVTLTDHNRIDGALLLRQKHPDDVFLSVEATTYFPEDECKMHILVYGISETQFEEIQKLRINIYDLRAYLHQENLSHSVAHALFAVNNKLTLEHLEKLILMFDVFEGINGSRNKQSNELWMRLLRNLTPEHIKRLVEKHKIQPYSDMPWKKGFTAGSDDHAAFFISKTYTTSPAKSMQDFILSIREKETLAAGNHNNSQNLAFAIYKIAYDFSKSKSTQKTDSILFQLNEFIFEKKPVSMKNKIKMQIGKARGKATDIQKKLIEITDHLKEEMPIEQKLDIVYEKIADVSDIFFKRILTSLSADLINGDIINLVKNVSASLPGIFLSLPFFSSLKHMFDNRKLIDQLFKAFNVRQKTSEDGRKILWFTDTINDLNGVSMTLQQIGKIAYSKNIPLKIVVSTKSEKTFSETRHSIINVPHIFSTKLPFYERLELRIPSLLKALKQFYDFEPDEIVVSSPGPMGLLGLLTAKLFNIPVAGVYHTDFISQAQQINVDEGLIKLMKSVEQWFYSTLDEVWVPTSEYMNILENRGVERIRMKIFHRGIDVEHFSPRAYNYQFIKKKYGIREGIDLLFVGRISKDKNLDFLLETYTAIAQTKKQVNLILAGDGPYYEELKDKTAGMEGVYLTDTLSQEMLPDMYSGADLFVMPSTTDTFGMVVLEAQSCGLPAVVSDVGGPKEIIVEGVTGYIAKANDKADWVEKIESVIRLKEENPEKYEELKNRARTHVLDKYDWNSVIKEYQRAG